MVGDKKVKTKTATPVKKAPTVTKPKREVRNGVPRPGVNTITGRVWTIADALAKKLKGKPAPRKDVLASCEDEKINPATAATQYGRWRKFNGHVGKGTENE